MTRRSRTARSASALALVVSLVSCASFDIDPAISSSQINALRKTVPSFSGIGSIQITGGMKSFSGSIALALDGNMYRIEIFDSMGRTALAIAGEPGRMTKINPSTGEKSRFSGAKADTVRFEQFKIPVSAISSIIYGQPPHFKRLDYAYDYNGLKVAHVSDPEMKLEYTNRLQRVEMIDEREDERIVITLAAQVNGQLAPYVARSQLDFKTMGLRTALEWKKVRQGLKFPDGFFSFDEQID